MKDWNDQKVVIVGAARQGTALARFLCARGAQVVLNDLRPAEELQTARDALADLSAAGLNIEWVCGGHPLSLLDGTDMLCVSGGVPLTLPLVIEAQARGIPLSNDSQIFMEVVPCEVIGITGSAGKTTTTTLVGRMAQAATNLSRSRIYNRRIWVGGNIGSPLISIVDQMQPGDMVVMELSSFQLEIMDLAPQVAAVLNITPNHLDRHGTMEAYSAAKAHILEYQSPSDVAILGRDDPGAWSLAQKARGQVFSFGFTELAEDQAGTFLWDQKIYLRPYKTQAEIMVRSQRGVGPGPRDIYLMKRIDVPLRGEHNLLNVMAACTIAAAAGLPLDAMRVGLEGFTGVPHRLEYVRSWGGADWYNDSIATAPERAMAAIRSFDEPLVMLVGGRDKNLPWDEFAALAHHRVDHLIVFGEAVDTISQALASTDVGEGDMTVTRCASLREAVQVAAQIVQPGDVVLLSPGGTSFDEFRDFEERGECFALWVRELP